MSDVEAEIIKRDLCYERGQKEKRKKRKREKEEDEERDLGSCPSTYMPPAEESFLHLRNLR